ATMARLRRRYSSIGHCTHVPSFPTNARTSVSSLQGLELWPWLEPLPPNLSCGSIWAWVVPDSRKFADSSRWATFSILRDNGPENSRHSRGYPLVGLSLSKPFYPQPREY